MASHFSESHTESDCLRAVIARRWAKNAVAAVMTGALVVGSLSVPALSQVASAAPSNESQPVAASVEGGTENTAPDNKTGESEADTGNTAPDTPDVPAVNPPASGDDEGDKIDGDGGSTPKEDDPEAEDAKSDPKEPEADISDPEAAKPSEEFGAPTTSVVIEGSINGSLLAKVALAEPDGVPEGGNVNKYNYGSGEPWCAYFVMYCARALGLSTVCIPNYPGCPALVSYYKSQNRWQDFTPQYTPHVGDLIFYSKSPGGTASHVGIVTASTATTVTTREGNTSGGAVASHVFSTTNESGLIGNDFYILGYAAPDYPDPSSLDHMNNIASVLNVSETSHLVTYEPCVCGYQKESDLVAHNFKATEGDSLKLSESEEWVCIDCGATKKNYATGIVTSSQEIELYDASGANVAKELSKGSSLAIASVYLGEDGNYWGVTADGYKVKMAAAGVKQRTQFAKANETEERRVEEIEKTSDAAAGKGSVAYDSVSLGTFDTYVIGSAEQGTIDATCKGIAELKAGNLYVVTIGSVESTSLFADDHTKIGTPMLKVLDGSDGSYDTDALRVCGTFSYKLDYSSDTQTIVVAPERDCTLAVACQWGKWGSCNSAQFSNVVVHRVS